MEMHLSPTGVLSWDKKKAFEGYTVLCPMFSTSAFLLDMEGNIVHEWKTKYPPGLYAELLPNGNIIRGARTENNPVWFGGTSGRVEELDWEGNVVWAYDIKDKHHTQHHCFKRLPNGNTFLLCWEYKSRKEAIAKGRDPKTITEKGVMYHDVAHKGLWPDYLVEVDKKGDVVWEWHAWDHIGTGKNKLDINYKLPDTMGYLGMPDWTHFNTVEYDEKRGLILLNSRNFGEFYLVDHKTGKIVYRWGNPNAYGKGKAPTFCDDGDQILFGPHHPTFLENGNILVFDNGWQRPELNRSRAVEMNPETGKIVWEYASNNPNCFYSPYQGACQRLPNGNTLITSSNTGHVFEVTKECEVVWEFINPWGENGEPKALLNDATITMFGTKQDLGIQWNTTHRAYRYAPNHPGFKGRDLSKKRPILKDMPRWWEIFGKLS